MGLRPRRRAKRRLPPTAASGRALAEASEAGTATRALVERVVAGAVGARGADARLRLAAQLLEPAETKARGRGKGASRSAPERELLGERLEALSAHASRSRACWRRGGDERFLAHSPSADTAALAERWGAARLTAAFAAVGRAREALERNTSPKVVADWLALQL